MAEGFDVNKSWDPRLTPKSAPTFSDSNRGVFVISVAAELAGVHAQTLRMYERKGLLQPDRTAGGARRYSERDIEHVKLIQELTQEVGVNLAGVEVILDLTRQLQAAQEEIGALKARLSAKGL
ncbi:MAG: heat shock protein transcriptional repressor HspR [Actinomycetota bacterium]